MDRGIITPENILTNKGEDLHVDTAITTQFLRYYCLYWDKISVIQHPNMYGNYKDGDEIKILESANIIQISKFKPPKGGSHGAPQIVQNHVQGVAEEADVLINKNPGQWTIHQNSDQLIIPNNMSQPLLTADFQLMSCLPVPLPDIPLEKVLDFKVRREDELLALRISLDELYLGISQASDIPRSKVTQVQKLELAIKDLDKVAKESWKHRLLASRKISIDLNYNSVVNGVATGGAIGAVFSNPLVGVIAGGAHSILSSLKFEVTMSGQLSSSIGQKPDLSYLSSLKSEDIV